MTVQAMLEQPPFIEVVEKRVGKLQVDSTPSGAEAILDGKKYGQTPVTIPDLEAGLHTLVLKSTAGSITRKRHDQGESDDAAGRSDFLRLARDLLADSGESHRSMAIRSA